MNILFITRDFSSRIEKSSLYLLEELKKHANVVTDYDGGNIRDILKRTNFRPDFILLNDLKPDYSPFVYGLNDFPVPTGAIMHDLMYRPHYRKRYYREQNIRHIFTIYRDAAYALMPELKDRLIWLPHHVPTHIFKDYKHKKTIPVLMMGAIFPQLYPARTKFFELLKDYSGFVYHPHPGYRDIKQKVRVVYAGKKYAEEINRARIFVTCDSKDHLPVLKYFEVPACRTLLLATTSKELEDLGFIDGKTFVSVNEHNLIEKIHYYLRNGKERKKIADAGWRMVRQRHSTAKRTKELLKYIRDAVVGKPVGK